MSRARVAASAGVALLFAASLWIRIGDADPFSHLATGRWILAHGAIPHADPFSHTFAGRPWRYTEWLAEIGYAGAYALGGLGALVALHAALAGLLALLAARLARAGAAATLLSVGLFAAASHAVMSQKPQVFSYLAAATVMLILRAAEERAADGGRPRALLALPPLFLLWANLHRGGLLGVGLVGLAVLGWALRPQTRRLVGPAALALALSALALLANPGGTFYFTSALDVVGRSSFREMLSEWQPASVALLAENHLALLPLALLATAARLRPEGRRVDVELLVVLATALLAARAVRLVPFFALGLVPPAARGAELALAWLSARARPALASALVGLLGPAALGAHVLGHVSPAYLGAGAMEERVPVALAAFLRAHPPPGRMWNAFDFGGYFVHALGPEIPVFIDGRNDVVYDDAFFREAMEAPGRPDLFAAQVERYGIDFAAVRWSGPGDGSFAFLHASSAWQLVYWDDLGAVLVRRSERSGAYLDRWGYREVRVDTAFPRSEALGGAPADRAFLAELDRQVEEAPGSLRALWLAAHAWLRVDPARGALLGERAMRLAADHDVDLPPP